MALHNFTINCRIRSVNTCNLFCFVHLLTGRFSPRTSVAMLQRAVSFLPTLANAAKSCRNALPIPRSCKFFSKDMNSLALPIYDVSFEEVSVPVRLVPPGRLRDVKGAGGSGVPSEILSGYRAILGKPRYEFFHHV